jgi:hypothetical protein
MNNYVMTLWSDNHEMFKEITWDWDPGPFRIDRRNSNKGAYIDITAPYLPFAAIQELSALHPEMSFTLSYTYDGDGHDREYRYEFKAGVKKFVDVEASYFWPASMSIIDGQAFEPGSMELPDRETACRLKENMIEVFQRIDVTTGEGEQKDVHWHKGEVSVTAEYGDWKMKATKSGPSIADVKIYTKRQTMVWEEVSLDVDDFIPM